MEWKHLKTRESEGESRGRGRERRLEDLLFPTFVPLSWKVQFFFQVSLRERRRLSKLSIAEKEK